MYQSLGQALQDAFTQSERAIMGYSNTASIMRLGEQCGASGSTSPDELSQHDRLTQAVWLLEIIEETLRCPMEIAAIYCQYGQGSTRYAEGLIELAKHFDHVHGNILVIDDLLSHIYSHKPSVTRMSDKYEMQRKSLYRKRDRIEKKCREWQYNAEEKLIAILLNKGILKQKVA